jgi:hypothetical protein
MQFFAFVVAFVVVFLVFAEAKIKQSASNYVPRRNVKDYGAKGDGVTDDTAAIIRAITESRGDDPNAAYPTV